MSIDHQHCLQNRNLDSNMTNYWLASLTIRKGLFKFVGFLNPSFCLGEVTLSSW